MLEQTQESRCGASVGCGILRVMRNGRISLRCFASISLLLLCVPCLAQTNGKYYYDPTGRLVKIDYGSAGVITYTYDQAGNLITRQVLPALTTGASSPAIQAVVNAESNTPTIAPNTWVSIYGTNLSPPGDSRIWLGPDFVNNQLPTQLDGVGVTVNGKSAYVSYISPLQVNVLTPPDPMLGAVQVQLTNGSAASAAFTVQAQSASPGFFVFNGGPYVVALHANYSFVGPTTLYPGQTTPAAPGEIILLYADGFGNTSSPVTSGSLAQGGTLPILPVVKIGGTVATVQYAGLISPGLYQFNVVVPPNAPNGDNALSATYGGLTTQAGVLVTVQH
jgi:uncharacterized protein (TIGR03437 family)